jgi:hypothetical protein
MTTTFFTTFLDLLLSNFARLEAACISASETSSEAFLFLLLDSKDLVFDGQIAGNKSIAGKFETTNEEIPENNNLIRLGRRGLFVRRRTTITGRKETSLLVCLDKFAGNFRFSENKDRRV